VRRAQPFGLRHRRFLLNHSLTARRSRDAVMQEGKDYCMLDPQRGDLGAQVRACIGF
jgi:hypothetical protein